MKYYLVDNNKEVKIGDTISITTTVDTMFGPATATAHVVVTQDNIKVLIEKGLIKREAKSLTSDLCIDIIAKKLDANRGQIKELFAMMLSKKTYAPVLQLLLKAASDYLSPGISVVQSLPKVYTISLVDGRIHEIQATDIKTYEHFAYFVSKSQAKQVKYMFKDLFREMYGE